MFRALGIKGIGSQFTGILEADATGTVKKLATGNTANLFQNLYSDFVKAVISAIKLLIV